MKKLLLLLIIPIFFSCTGNNKKTDEDILEEHIKIELAKEETVNDIFLDFKFGDSETDVANKLIKLSSENKISINVLYEYVYEFTGLEYTQNGEAVLSFEYFEGKLYKLKLNIDPIQNRYYSYNGTIKEPDTNVALLWWGLLKLYEQKFGPALRTKDLFSEASRGYDKHHWVHNNRMITSSLFSDVTIEYVDLNIQSKVEQKEKLEKKSKNIKMQDDL